MEICNCTLAIAGDPRATIQKPSISIAEIVVLQHIHGDSAVTNIKVISSSDKSNEEERDHLGKLYKDEKIIEIFGQYGELPQSLQDARIGDALLEPVWLNELQKELERNGSSMEQVLKVNVYLADLADYHKMNEVYRGRFGENPPVRTTVATYGGVPGNSLVEIDCIAAIV